MKNGTKLSPIHSETSEELYREEVQGQWSKPRPDAISHASMTLKYHLLAPLALNRSEKAIVRFGA